MDDPKFAVGAHVDHAKGTNFPAGCGTITEVLPWNTTDGYTYKVRCDKTQNVLPVSFKETDLKAHA
jgi:hypothetical protein